MCQEIDSLTHILDFLTECFYESFQYNTIAGFRSAISSYDPLEALQQVQFQEYQHFCLEFITTDPTTKVYFLRGCKTGIDFLATLPYDSDLSLKDLTLKLTMLLALTSAARVSEICYLDIRYLIKHNSGYIFYFGKKHKDQSEREAQKPN